MADTAGTATVNGANSTVETAQNTATEKAGTETAQAGKTYTQEDLDKIVNDRTDRASKAALKSYFEQKGVPADEIDKAIADYKTAKAKQDEADKGNLTAMQKKAEEAEKRAAAVEASAFSDLVEAKSEALAVSLGIDPAKLAYIRLDFSKVGKTDTGKPKAEDIKAVLEGALKVMPELKRTSEPIQTGVAPTNGGKPITGDDDAIRRAMGLPPKK